MLHWARGDIAQLVELRSCNWVVAITGWMSDRLGGNDSIFYPNRWLTFSQLWGIGPKHATEKLYRDKERWAVKNVEKVEWVVG